MKPIFLILSLILYVGCNEIPIDYLYPIDYEHKTCSKWKIVDKKNLKLVWVKDMPLSECDGFIAISYHDYLSFKRWVTGK